MPSGNCLGTESYKSSGYVKVSARFWCNTEQSETSTVCGNNGKIGTADFVRLEKWTKLVNDVYVRTAMDPSSKLGTSTKIKLDK